MPTPSEPQRMSPLLKLYFLASSLNKTVSRYESMVRDGFTADGRLLLDQQALETLALLKHDRWLFAQTLDVLSEEESRLLVKIDDLYIASGRLRGGLFGQDCSTEETACVEARLQDFLLDWTHHNAFKAFTLLSFYYQPYELPIQKNIRALNAAERSRYLYFVMRPPHIMQESDEQKYIQYCLNLTDWLIELIEESDRPNDIDPKGLIKLASKMLNFGTCYYLDRSISSVIRARARLIDAITKRWPDFVAVVDFPKSSPVASQRSKLRLGILARNAGDFSDTRALFAFFHAFDTDKYEIYWYSLDIAETSGGSDVDFLRKLYSFTHTIVTLRGDAVEQAQMILNNDLDILIAGCAYSFGANQMDQLLFKRLARVQIQLNAMMPSSSGFASFDYVILPEAESDAMANYRTEACETIKTLSGPLVWFDKPQSTLPSLKISRKNLGIPDDAFVYCSGAAANRQMPGLITTWLRLLREVPHSYLLLFPFNTAFSNDFLGLTYLSRLSAAQEDYPDIDPDRIKIVSQLGTDDGNRLIELSDVYLSSFPHGSATMTMQGLKHGKPVVTRKSWWLRSTGDPSLIKCLGLDEILAHNTDEIVTIAAKLAHDKAFYQKIQSKISERIENAPFFRTYDQSRNLQYLVDDIAFETGLVESKARLTPFPKAG